MNKNVFLADLKAKGKNVEWLTKQLENEDIHLNESSFYKRLRGEVDFRVPEIKAVCKVMEYSANKMNTIFFNELVS